MPRACRSSRFPVLAVVLFAALLLAHPSSAARRSATNLLPNGSFERGVAGWKGHRASLRIVRRGVAGRAARVVLRGKRSWIYRVPKPALTTAAGALYTASAYVRTTKRRQRVCLVIVETRKGARTRTAKRCRVAKRAWQRFAKLRYRSTVNGAQLGITVIGSRPGSFVIDEISLSTPAGASAPPASSPPAAPPAVPSFDRWYSTASPFNQPIAVDVSVDPSSAAMVNTLINGAQNGFSIGAKAWTTPVYYSSASTVKTTVTMKASWAPVKQMAGVPIPANAEPDPEGDHHLTIMDPATGCEYDMWQAQRNADGTWSASWGNATMSTGSGVYEGGWATTASGFANALGKIRPEEMAAGAIEHALVFGFPYTKAGGPVLPATSSDGKSTVAGAIPEGAHLQLDPGLDLGSLGLNAWQTTVARALQKYGMFLGDTGSTVGLSAINARSFSGTPYPWGDLDYAPMPKELLKHMRVLSLPPQYKPQGKLIPTSCATLQ